MENEKELREIQDISELASVPVGEIVVYRGKKIEVRNWNIDIMCYGCYFMRNAIKTCRKASCVQLSRPDKKSVSYVVIN